MPSVVELTCYPVKSCAGIALPAAEVTDAGLAHDRSFLVVGEDGVFRSQRRDPRLAVIRPEIDGDRLTLRAPEAGRVDVDVDVRGQRRDILLFDQPLRGIDQGDEVAAWLTGVLGVPSRLVRVPPEHDRVVEGETPGTSGYADSAAVHLVSVRSWSALNERIAARGGTSVPMSRFRPNVVVDGWDEPHAEDLARRITAGGVELGRCKPAIRCAVALVDQQAGTRAGPEPIRTLADYRRTPEGVAFGVKFSVLRPGLLRVGDELTVSD